MKSRQFAFKAAVALTLVALILGLSASPASAGWPRRAVVVATPVAPAYVAASPVAVVGAPVATVEVTVVHNAYDHDVDAAIEVGGGTSSSLDGGTISSPPLLAYPLPATSGAASSDWVTGISSSGNVAWTFSFGIPPGEVNAYLPPDPDRVPHPLRFARPGLLPRLLKGANFRQVRAQGVQSPFVIRDEEEFVEMSLQARSPMRTLYDTLTRARQRALRANLARGIRRFRSGGVIRCPGFAWVVSGRR